MVHMFRCGQLTTQLLLHEMAMDSHLMAIHNHGFVMAWWFMKRFEAIVGVLSEMYSRQTGTRTVFRVTSLDTPLSYVELMATPGTEQHLAFAAATSVGVW